jgi:hypothetical protein
LPDRQHLAAIRRSPDDAGKTIDTPPSYLLYALVGHLRIPRRRGVRIALGIVLVFAAILSIDVQHARR